MNKTLLIIGREYLSRVRKKSFILLTFLVPLLIVGMYAAIFWLAFSSKGDLKRISVLDESGIFAEGFTDTESIRFSQESASLDEAKKRVLDQEDQLLLHIPPFQGEFPSGVEIFSSKQASLGLMENIENQMERIMRERKLIEAGIDTALISNLQADISLSTTRLSKKGEEKTSTGAAYGVAMACCILIYLFIFLYGIQVMRGVIEEKTSRIVEVIISSVKPYQLMLGKIVGIALVGLTQFMLWVLLSLVATGLIQAAFSDKLQSGEAASSEQAAVLAQGAAGQANPALEVLQALGTLNIPLILVCFLVYFLGGYLLYSALFAAAGAAVDNETETQQFTFPVTLPLLFAYISSFTLIQNPDSALLYWLSMIPFTSPVSMMVRLPFGVPVWEILVSVALLIATFLGTVWFAGRIYRTGILMYGKKVTLREVGKWLFYKG